MYLRLKSSVLIAALFLPVSGTMELAAAGKSQQTKPDGSESRQAAKIESKADPVKQSVLDTAVSVCPEDLVSKPHEWLGKNVKIEARFFAWSNLALDYKPAFRSSKTHLSFLILKQKSHVPLSELKLAMMIPKDKDPDTALFAALKDGDKIELVGKVFSTALDDPWVEVYRLKKLGVSPAGQSKTAVGANKAGENPHETEEKENEAK